MKPDRARLFTESFIAGVIGYAAVALYLAGWNLILGRHPLYTAALLGQSVVGAPASVNDVAIGFGPIVAYNALHLLVFLIIGLVAASLVVLTERQPRFWFMGLMIFVAGMMASIAIVVAYAVPVADRLPWWSIVSANVVAAILMGAYLLNAHPRLLAGTGEYR